MKRRFLIPALLVLFFILLGWLLLLLEDTLSPFSFGALPGIVLAAMMTSDFSMVLFSALCLAFYVLLELSLYFNHCGHRWAAITGTICLCLDMAACLVFTTFSLWFLIGIFLDISFLVMLWSVALTQE